MPASTRRGWDLGYELGVRGAEVVKVEGGHAGDGVDGRLLVAQVHVELVREAGRQLRHPARAA